MNGYVKNKISGVVLAVILDVISAGDTEILGQNASLRGVDLMTAEVMITDTVYQVGDTVAADEIDKREQLPQTPNQEGVDTSLSLAEAYETILTQQSAINALTARIVALEGDRT